MPDGIELMISLTVIIIWCMRVKSKLFYNLFSFVGLLKISTKKSVEISM